MTSYANFPTPYGVNIVSELNSEDLYTVARSQVAVFPFKLDKFGAVLVQAGHSSFYNNQQGTIVAWASDEINGRNITAVPNSNLGRISLQGSGFSWLFHSLNLDLTNYPDAAIRQWLDTEKTYFMCFQNTENKDNGFSVKFTHLL